MANYVDSGRTPPVSQWQHVAATYDGATARFYVDGTEVARRLFQGNVGDSNTWRIGAYGASPGGYFVGLIDDVRIYNRALTAGEIGTDMATPVPSAAPLTTAPAAPTNLVATGAEGRASVTWTPPEDDVAAYDVYRSTSASFTPTGANRVGRTTVPAFTDPGLLAGTYYYEVTAEDAAGAESVASHAAAAVVAADVTPPAVTISAPAAGATLTGSVSVEAAASDDSGAVASVQFQLDGANLGAPDSSAPFAIAWDTSLAANGPHTLAAVARDRAGNARASAAVSVTVAKAVVAPSGLVASYSFDEGAGTVAADGSGGGHDGTVVGAAWTTASRVGSALQFGGAPQRVDLPPLGTFYKAAFTLEAWVRPDALSQVFDTAVVGSWTTDDGGAMIWIDGVAGRYRLSLGQELSVYLDSVVYPSSYAWHHVAATYDGTTARFFLDGTEVASKPFSGDIGDSDTWRIGAYGSTPTGFFNGALDEVKIYDRALSASEIRGDFDATGGPADNSSPTMPTAFIVTGRTPTTISTTWGASTDDVGVVAYDLFRNGVKVGSTSTTSFTFDSLTCNQTYTLGVSARDASGKSSSRSQLTSAYTALCPYPTTLVASYRLDDGVGTAAGDASGLGRTGTLVSGARWAASGEHGGAVELDGVSGHVDLPALGTAVPWTLEAWVKPAREAGDVAIVGSWTSADRGGPMIWIDHLSGHYRLTFGTDIANYLDSGVTPVVGEWHHVAATTDGTTARFFVDGVQVASRPVAVYVGYANTWRIGAYGSTPTGFFPGLIDDVRIYRGALSAAEIQRDMNAAP